MKESERYEENQFKGRNRRLLNEWRRLEDRLEGRRDIQCEAVRRNTAGLPVRYLVRYNLRSICGVSDVEHLGEPGVCNTPLYASGYQMLIDIPDGYPSIDAPASFRFLTCDDKGRPMAHPWHPNIRYFGDFSGRVCLNQPDTYTDLAWCVERVAHYLRYDTYHAVMEPPYPEDLKVASWVIRQGEPNGWIFFDQE